MRLINWCCKVSTLELNKMSVVDSGYCQEGRINGKEMACEARLKIIPQTHIFSYN